MPFLKLKTVIIIIWMFHSLSLNNKINRFHERSLGIIYSHKRSIFEELLAKDYCLSTPQKHSCNGYSNYKLVNGIYTEIMNEVFEVREQTHYHLRHTAQFLFNPVHSVFNIKYLFRLIFETQIHIEIHIRYFK